MNFDQAILATLLELDRILALHNSRDDFPYILLQLSRSNQSDMCMILVMSRDYLIDAHPCRTYEPRFHLPIEYYPNHRSSLDARNEISERALGGGTRDGG